MSFFIIPGSAGSSADLIVEPTLYSLDNPGANQFTLGPRNPGWIPEDNNCLFCTADPAAYSSNALLVSGTVYVTKLRVRTGATIATVKVATNGTATLTTGNYVGIYDLAGNRLAVSGDQTTDWGPSDILARA